ncbi:hypothetical protein FRACYDRAFT_237343 [Fragilariopsis cylindrus CCMP1102]|uniref:Uncharacterized protein n=1 Tax=Fragilariopsis cylindrus CCMP1102 TaxID=635003 RepID=A0A1E7FLL1_9STRA|nr:hypothetical protein FRACYDRAFT_237343 [Fragilariopsis cylindrus CCMP1102]|eukprot:OEU19052.1 hypothetical protein FRACYDRAFT_237343 [Fragilariopsis cylindrus CCMP1102]
MSDYNNTEWEGTASGAFPSRYDYDHNKQPIKNMDEKDDATISSSNGDDSKDHHICVDNNNDVFPDNDGALFDSFENINESSRELGEHQTVVSSLSYDGLMNVSHSSSSMTPAISNTTTANVVRDAIKKSKEQLQKSDIKTTTSREEERSSTNGGEGGVSGCFYPYNMFRTQSKGKLRLDEARKGKKKKETTKNNSNDNGKRDDNTNDNSNKKRVAATATAGSHHVPSYNKTEDHSKRDTEYCEQQHQEQMPPILPPLLTSVMEDEPSSVITGEDEQEQYQHQHQHQHQPVIEHNQYVYDYMMEGASVMSAARSRVSRLSRPQRRVPPHGGGDGGVISIPKKQNMIRYTLATSQQEHLFGSIEEKRYMHRLTAQHLRAIHHWLLFLPAVLLTLISGVLVLVFEADLNLDDDKIDIIHVYSSITVGVLLLVSVLWQALCKQLDFGVQGALHDSCAIALKRLSEDILLTLSAVAMVETIPAEYVAMIGEKYEQAVDSCATPTSCTIPYKLEAAFTTLSNRMRLMLQPLPTIMMGGENASEARGIGSGKNVQNLDLFRLYATAYDELSSQVVNYCLFPFTFPNPRRASEYALRNFKAIITEGKEIDRSCGKQYCYKCFCPCFGSLDEERSLFYVLSPPAPPPVAAAGVPIERQPTHISF